MASDRQIRANRRNALLSTGPKTEDGKAAIASNALRHGLTARQIVLQGEDPAEFEALREALIGELRPDTALEGVLVDRLAGLFWRLRRIPRFEAALLTVMRSREDKYRNATSLRLGGVIVSCDHPVVTQQAAQTDAQERHERSTIGRVLETAFVDGDVLNKLSRYERELMRQVERVLAELTRCRGHVAVARLLARRAD